MGKLDAAHLQGASVTLMGPLWARAKEALAPDPILKDEKAVELVESIDFPFEDLDKARLNGASFCIRARIFDTIVGEFLEQHPNGTVAEIGVGLDTRFERVDNGMATWFELDLPDVIDLRKRLLAETPRRRFLPGSAHDDEWLETVAAAHPAAVLFVAEGVLFYFTSEGVMMLLQRLADRFPGSAVVFDCLSPFYMAFNNLMLKFRTATIAPMTWSLGSTATIERWDSRFKVEKCIDAGDPQYYAEEHLRRIPKYQQLMLSVYPPARRMFRICQVGLRHA